MSCDCPPLHWVVPDDGDPIVRANYTNPITDQVEWYDADIVESGQFLGYLIQDVTQNSVASRSVKTRISSSGGGVLGPTRTMERRLDFTVLLFACNELAMQYGFRYLTDALHSGGCDDACTLCDAEFRDSCGPIEGTPDQADLDRGRWLLKNVGCIEGPIWDEAPVQGMTANIRSVKFSLVSEYPWKFKCPEVVEANLSLAGYDSWAADCTNVLHALCEQEYVYASVTEPLVIGETALIINVTAGDAPLRHVEISIIPDRDGYESAPETAPVGYTPATPCDYIRIRSLPASATLTYDTAIESITVQLPGGAIVDGSPYLSPKEGNPPTFPTVRCGKIAIRVGAAECSVVGNAHVSVQSVHREI